MITDYQQISAFHSHSCPGQAMGYRVAAAAMAVLNKTRARDEELVAVVENDACGVDALQCLSGWQERVSIGRRLIVPVPWVVSRWQLACPCYLPGRLDRLSAGKRPHIFEVRCASAGCLQA